MQHHTNNFISFFLIFYIRYVDDFVIFDADKKKLLICKHKIDSLLKTIKLELHPDKAKIRALDRGICFLGFRVFYYHRLLKKSNIKKMKRKLLKFREQFEIDKINYDKIHASLEGWIAYASKGDTYNLRLKFIKKFEKLFPNKIADIEINIWLKAIKLLADNV